MSAFRANFLFTPIDEDSFVDLLTPVSQHLCPELSLVAEEEGAPVSFLLGAAAARMGFGRAIHALMHRSNHSMVWSAKLGRTIRRYALFARELAP